MTLMLAFVTVPLNTLFGTVAAINLTRNEFPGKVGPWGMKKRERWRGTTVQAAAALTFQGVSTGHFLDGVSGLVLQGCGNSIIDGWQPEAAARVHTSTRSSSAACKGGAGAAGEGAALQPRPLQL